MATVATIEGLDKLWKKFENMGDTTTYRRAVEKACRSVEYKAKKKCPRKTGVLEASITHVVEATGGHLDGYVGTNTEYAPYVEFGTGLYAENGDGRKTPWAYEDPETGETIWTAGQDPQPYLRPALTESREDIRNILKDAIKKG